MKNLFFLLILILMACYTIKHEIDMPCGHAHKMVLLEHVQCK